MFKTFAIFEKKIQVNMMKNVKNCYKYAFPLIWRIFLMEKYPFIPAQNFSFICSKILYKDFLIKPRGRRYSQRCTKIFYKTNKMRYLHKINEKSRAGINGYF